MNPSQLVENRSSLLIFRDCIKLASRMVTQQQKVTAIRKLVRRQFQKNKEVFDQDTIKSLKMKQIIGIMHSAVKGISNYIIHVVQMEYKLNKRKQVNIMDEAENAREQEQDLEANHTSNTGNSKFDEVK